MKLKLIIGVAIVVALALGGYGISVALSGTSNAGYQFATVTRGDIENTISATGTLSPVTTVDVGTQVSGTIDSVFVDYNDYVNEGQVLAVLDTSLLSIAVSDADANVTKADAQLDQAKFDFDRNKAMFDKGLISESDFLPYSVALKMQKAALESAQMAERRAKKNLEYAVITSPISGTIISKNVEAGQTVAASFSTPTLFTIAQDLSHMEIMVDVDESDIGQIKDGQQVEFQVAAYSDKTFNGIVKQIRLEPKTVSNVVTYNVVVQADNNEGLLMPGMTATVDIIVQKKDDALMVADKALRFQPSEELLKKAFGGKGEQAADSVGSHVNRSQSAEGTGTSGGPGVHRPRDIGILWFLDSNGKLERETVKTGISDGVNTEIMAGTGITDGMQVISGVRSTDESSSASQSRSGMHFRGPRGF